MSRYGTTLTVLCTGLAAAVAEDEKPEAGGFDLSAGMFGPAVSEWLHQTAESISEQTRPVKEGSMQIIRRGNLDKERSYRAECPNCTCLFNFKRGEAEEVGYPPKLAVRCPDAACGHLFAYSPKYHESQGVL